MTYDEHFKEHYREWFSRFKVNNLLKVESSLSEFIDSDLYDGFILCDEVNVLYELVRDELVERCSLMARRIDADGGE